MEEENNQKIKQLDGQTIRRIASGQVIISMASAVKELIENSLDAGAKTIAIRFVDNGKESIEVSDNGYGIEESNFELLGRRNCTSKLLTFDNLNLVQTFGFRGEALNSLCNLANVKIHTRHSSKDMGTILLFDTNGRIIDKELKPREIGTTITLTQLFSPLPVRRKEFVNNIKRQFDKTLSTIYQYCIGLIGFKISVFNKKNNSSTFSPIFTNNGISIQSNIIDIFDYKQFSHLMPFVCDEDLSDYQHHSNDVDMKLKINGFISKPDSGCGRCNPDRQFYYINGKPCDLPDVSKKINQIYRTFNRNQYPFILLKIEIDEKIVDRNYTPDKRKIMLADNHYLLKIISNSVEKLFCPDTNEVLSLSQYQSSMSSFLKRALDEKNDDTDSDNTKIAKTNGSLLLDTPIEKLQHLPLKTNLPSNNQDFPKMNIIFEEPPKHQSKVNHLHPFFNNLKPITNGHEPESMKTVISDAIEKTNHLNLNETIVKGLQSSEKVSRIPEKVILDDSDTESVIANRQNLEVSISTNEICQKFQKFYSKNKSKFNITENDFDFQAKIKPEDNSQALAELTQVLSKKSFQEMQIIGQFNLGFIIAEYQKNLFIIDQHAMDERYNFEMFLNNPKISYQNLAIPLNLKLSTINEMILIDYLDVFKKFGFNFQIDNNSEIGQRIKLTKIPIGQEWTASKSDIEELINAIRDSPLNFQKEEKYFPFSGLKREIAYKACRSSIMIGQALNKNQMKKILSQMINIRDPWHCAHNRPTIRHLISINRF